MDSSGNIMEAEPNHMDNKAHTPPPLLLNFHLIYNGILIILFLHAFYPLHGQATIARGNDAGPHRIKDTMAFMFESCLMPRICPWALESPSVDHDYYQCWIGLKSHFIHNKEDTSLQNGHTKTGE